MTWNEYRRKHLTPNGWRYDSPGCYLHQETGNQFHPHDYAGGMVMWKRYAELDEAPDPAQTHMERRWLWQDEPRQGRRAVEVQNG